MVARERKGNSYYMKKRRFFLLLCLVAALAASVLAGCGKTDDPPVTDKGHKLTVTADGESNYAIVYPEGNVTAQKMATTFTNFLNATTGVRIKPVSDTEPEGTYEILIGPTNRALSSALRAKIEAMNSEDNNFGLMGGGESIALYANTTVGFEKLLDRIGKTYISGTSFSVNSKVEDVRTFTKAQYEKELADKAAAEEERRQEEMNRKADLLKEELKKFTDEQFGGTNITVLPSDVYAAPETTPTAGAHPRLLFTADDLPAIRAAMEDPTYAELVKKFMSYVERDTDGKLGTAWERQNGKWNYDADILTAIASKALYYQITGQRYYGYSAVLAMKNYHITLDIQWKASDQCRQYGHVMFVTGLVYDWCYDLLTAADRKQLTLGVEYLCCRGTSGDPGKASFGGLKMEIGFPPKCTTAVSGHDTEMQLLRDYLSFAVAIYDETPSWWTYIGGEFYQEYVPVRDVMYTSHMAADGTATYAQYRFMADLWSAWIVSVATGEMPYKAADMKEITRSLISHEVGNGDLFYTDDGNNRTVKQDKLRTCAAISAYLFGDRTVWTFFRDMSDNFKIFDAGSEFVTPEFFLIIASKKLVPSEDRHAGLPTILYNGGYYQQIIARDSWNADAPAVLLQGAMRIAGGHAHFSAGSFQIYYKGMLSAQDGVYDSYGSNHHYFYHQATVSHNSVLVYNSSLASEDRGWYSGGQRHVWTGSLGKVNTWLADDNFKMGECRGVAYGFRDGGKSPEYVYFANDLTAAYHTRTVQYIGRSTVVLYTDDPDYPMLLFVYDDISAKDANYKKSFLLQCVSKPVVDSAAGTVTVDNGLGKLVLTSLKGGDEFRAYGMGDNGDMSERFWISGQNRNLASGGGLSSDGGRNNTSSWGHVEISPATGEKENRLLNVMYVTDSGNMKTLPSVLLEGDGYIGSVTLGRAVIFMTRRNYVSDEFNVSLTGEGEMPVYLGGVAAGKWEVRVDGRVLTTVTATPEGHFLSFNAPAGDITLTPVK